MHSVHLEPQPIRQALFLSRWQHHTLTIRNVKSQRHKCQFKSTAHFRPPEPNYRRDCRRPNRGQKRNYRRDCRRYSLMLSPRPGAKTKRSRIPGLNHFAILG
jgi:hypothetical protein